MEIRTNNELSLRPCIITLFLTPESLKHPLKPAGALTVTQSVGQVGNDESAHAVK